MNDHRRPRASLVLTGASLLLLLAACGGGDKAVSPLTASPTASPAGSATPSPSPTPSPTAVPLSPYEADPAVQGFRAYQVAVADAINAQNLALPELMALSTPARQATTKASYTEELGHWSPGPTPYAVLGVSVVSDSRRDLTVCGLDTGWTLTARGGAPAGPRSVVGGTYRMALDGGVWKVDSVARDAAVNCAGVPIVEVPVP